MSFKVIVLPHAGGMAASYSFLKKYEDGFIEFETVELAGHGTRIKEKPSEALEQAVNDVYHEIEDSIEDTEYVLLGHSMGSWLAYELYYKILDEGNTLPLHIFFSGNTCPLDGYTGEKFSHMEDEEFMKHVVKTGQASAEWFRDAELREAFLPAMRADFHMLENCQVNRSRELIGCNITAIGGMQDAVVQNKLEQWSSVTKRECEVYYFPGGHFYMEDNEQEVVDLIYRTVEMCNNM